MVEKGYLTLDDGTTEGGFILNLDIVIAEWCQGFFCSEYCGVLILPGHSVLYVVRSVFCRGVSSFMLWDILGLPRGISAWTLWCILRLLRYFPRYWGIYWVC